METKSVAKVGMLVVVAFLVGGGLYYYLAHIRYNAYIVRVPFKDTRGLLRQSVVRMQGVAIGEVTSIDLDTRRTPFLPLVTMAIDEKYNIPKDSAFVIVSGLLITNPQVEVLPGNNPQILAKDNTAEGISGKPPGTLSTISPELQETVSKVNANFDNLSGKLNKAYVKIDRLLDQANTLVKTTNDTAAAAKGIIGDPTVKRSLLATLNNFQAVSQDAHKTARELSTELVSIAHSSKGNLDRLTSKLTDVLTRVDSTVDDANSVVKKLTEQVTDPRFQQSLQETADLARTTLARFNQIASDLHEITGDPALQTDLKQTVANLRVTTERGEQVLTKVDTLLGKLTGAVGSGSKPRLPKVNFVSDVSEQLNPDRFRVDVDARIDLGKRDLLDLGLYDLGQNTRVNLQVGTRLTQALVARYGLHASKLGVGLDYEPTPGTGFRADLWDTNRPRLDARGFYRVNSNASIWAGADALLRRPVPIIGLEFRR